jgi:hypothetical protein
MEKTARLTGYILHPLLMTSIAALIFLNAGTYLSFIPAEGRQSLYLLIFMFTCILPVIFIGLGLQLGRAGIIGEGFAGGKTFPLLITCIFHFSAYYILGYVEVAQTIRLLLLGSIISLAIVALLSLKLNVSLHMLSIGGLAGAVFIISIITGSNFSSLFMFIIMLSGILAASRLYLGIHTLTQVILGFGIGFLSLLITILVF